MKKILLSFLLLSSICIYTSAQITLGTNDFSKANDTFRVSMALPFVGMDATLTGANYTWDYSQLLNTYTGQTIDTFLNVATLPNYLNLYFSNQSFNPNRCNQATFTSTSFLGALGIPVNGAYNMFYNSAASFLQRGIGLATDTLAAPIAYTSPDIVYKFPLQYNNVDSSSSGLVISFIPGIYYSAYKTRINTVDGWGTLTTPYGTFPVLRMKSIIHEHDSIVLDTLGLNFGTDLPEVIEYKWLGAGKGIPLLQINTTFGVPTSIVYRDSARIVSVPEISASTFSFDVFPNPSAANISVRYFLEKASDVSFDIISTEGKTVYSEKSFFQAAGEQLHVIQLPYELSSGNYFLRMNAPPGIHRMQPLVLTK